MFEVIPVIVEENEMKANKGRMADALALRGDEGREKLR